MLTSLKTSACVLSLGILILSCSRKANDYSYLVSSYRKIHCTTMNSPKITLAERKKGIEKISRLKNEFNQALKYLKQEEKEKLNDMMSKAISDIQRGKCEWESHELILFHCRFHRFQKGFWFLRATHRIFSIKNKKGNSSDTKLLSKVYIRF